MPLKLGVVSAVLFSLCSFSATAGVVQVTSLTSNDYFDWGQIQNNPSVPSPQSITSSLLGRTGSISDTAGFTGETENSDWVGNFTKGDKVLYDGDPNMAFNSGNSVEVDFNTPIAGLLTQIQPGV